MNIKKQKIISVMLVVTLFFTLAISASARASDYIARASVSASSSGNGRISIEVKTLATGVMQEIGALTVVVSEKISEGNYQPVYTFTRNQYRNLVVKNRRSYSNMLTYQGTAGKSYYITAQCYAKNVNGSGTTWVGSNTIKAK